MVKWRTTILILGLVLLSCPSTPETGSSLQPVQSPDGSVEPATAIKSLGTLPAFELTDQLGRPFKSGQLEGNVWVANFIFTRCPTICPASTAKMADIQKRSRDLGSKLRFVSFSVDPEYDTPERLRDFGERYDADPKTWSLLTGPLEVVKQTVIKGMKIAMDGNTEAPASIVHGTHFVLIDAKMNIQGYYDYNRSRMISDLLRDARALIDAGD